MAVYPLREDLMRDLLDNSLAAVYWFVLLVLTVLVALALGITGGVSGPKERDEPYEGPERRRSKHDRGGIDND